MADIALIEHISAGEGAETGRYFDNVAVVQNIWYHAAVTFTGAADMTRNFN